MQKRKMLNSNTSFPDCTDCVKMLVYTMMQLAQPVLLKHECGAITSEIITVIVDNTIILLGYVLQCLSKQLINMLIKETIHLHV